MAGELLEEHFEERLRLAREISHSNFLVRRRGFERLELPLAPDELSEIVNDVSIVNFAERKAVKKRAQHRALSTIGTLATYKYVRVEDGRGLVKDLATATLASQRLMEGGWGWRRSGKKLDQQIERHIGIIASLEFDSIT